MSYLKIFFNRLDELSESRKRLIKILFLPIYFFYLVALKTVSLYLIAPILLHIIFRPKLNITLWSAAIFFILSYKMPWQITTEYGHYNIFEYLINIHKLTYLQSFLLSIFAIFAFASLSFLFANIFSRVIKKNNYLTLPLLILFFASLQIIIFVFTQSLDTGTLLQALVVLVATLFTHKIWILFVATQHFSFSNEKISFKKFYPNYLGYMSTTRETFYLKSYYTDSLAVFFKGIFLCVIILLFYFLFVSGVGPNIFFNTEIMCPNQISTKQFLLSYGSVRTAWFCLFRTEFLFSIVNHLIINFMHFVIPGYILGLNFTFPVENPLKYKSFGGFLKAIAYYYSLTLSRFFINEYYKLLKKVFNIKQIAFLSIFLGVLTGGFIFHLSRDVHYIITFRGWFYYAQLRQPLIYFLMLALMCSFDPFRKIEFFNSNKPVRIFLFLIFLIIFSIIRFFNGFYLITDFKDQIQYIRLLFGHLL